MRSSLLILQEWFKFGEIEYFEPNLNLKTGVPIVSKLAQLQNNDPRYRYGYILDGVAESAEDVIALQEAGCILDYVIYLHGPEELLRARQKDKWTDQTTGTVYHPVFNWPADEMIANKARVGKPTRKTQIIH